MRTLAQARHLAHPIGGVGQPADPGTALQALCRVVEGWPGWLMLVAHDKRVLARSGALARALDTPATAEAALNCTQLVHSDGADHCCLGFGDAAAKAEVSVLVQTRAGRGSTRALSARVEPIPLADGASAWLVHLDPYDEGLRDGAAAAWSEVVAMRRAAGQEEAVWLGQLTQRWVQPLVRPHWTGWMREGPGGSAECRAASGRLDRGLTQAAVCAAVAAARSRADHALPLTLPVTDGGELLHLIPSGPAPGWVLALLGGHVDGARAPMLRSLMMAVTAAGSEGPPAPSGDTGAWTWTALRGLTAREVEIVRLVAQGLPDKRIAQHLGLSFHTVRNHLRRIMHKLGVNSRAQIAFTLATRPDPAG